MCSSSLDYIKFSICYCIYFTCTTLFSHSLYSPNRRNNRIVSPILSSIYHLSPLSSLSIERRNKLLFLMLGSIYPSLSSLYNLFTKATNNLGEREERNSTRAFNCQIHKLFIISLFTKATNNSREKEERNSTEAL